MSKKLKLLPAFIAAFLCVGTLSACNTMEGIGEDVEAAGESLEDSAERNKNY